MSNTKTLVIVAMLLVAVFAGGWVLKAALLPAKTVTSQIDSAGDIIDKTYDAENAIYNYEWFKQQYEDIEATERMIRNTKVEMDAYKELYGNASEWGWQTRQDYNSLNKVYLGQQNFYEGLVGDYNAKAKMANRNIFMDSLPLQVEKVLW